MTKQELYQKHYKEKFMRRILTPRIIEDLKRFKQKPKVVKKLLEQLLEKKSLFLYGAVRTGKTLLASELLMQYIEYFYINEGKEYPVKFISFIDLINQLKDTFDNPEKSELSVIEPYLHYELVVFDDFGVWNNSVWLYNVLYSLINSRYEHMKSTIFTSNLSLTDISKNLNDLRITRRINDMCNGNIIEV